MAENYHDFVRMMDSQTKNGRLVQQPLQLRDAEAVLKSILQHYLGENQKSLSILMTDSAQALIMTDSIRFISYLPASPQACPPAT